MQSSLIPENVEGKENDLYHTETFATREEAQKCFVRAVKRLRNPKVWHKLAGALSAEFTLTDDAGNKEKDLAHVNDYYKIDIPGPGMRAGNGYDWVTVDAIEDHLNADAEVESFGLRLRPSPDPESKTTDAAHFFKATASSTFIIHRIGNVVTASYHGRNEVPNINTENKIDNLRNAIITSGALSGLSELQWSTLIKAFLHDEIGG